MESSVTALKSLLHLAPCADGEQRHLSEVLSGEQPGSSGRGLRASRLLSIPQKLPRSVSRQLIGHRRMGGFETVERQRLSV